MNPQIAHPRKWRAVVLDVELPSGCRGIYVGGAGNVALVGDDGVSQIFNAPAGVTLDLGPTRVLTAGTTATGLVALY